MKNILNGKWVIDSNIFIYGFDEKSHYYAQARAIFSSVLVGEIDGVIAQQNISEMVQVLIKGYKLSAANVVNSVGQFVDEMSFEVISPKPKTYQLFFSLVGNNQSPVDIYDYFLAATMLDNDICQILTVNTKDFVHVPGITAVNPFE